MFIQSDEHVIAVTMKTRMLEKREGWERGIAGVLAITRSTVHGYGYLLILGVSEPRHETLFVKSTATELSSVTSRRRSRVDDFARKRWLEDRAAFAPELFL